MADLSGSNALLNDEDKEKQQAGLGQVGAQSSTAGFVSGGGSSSSSQQAGAGGTGGWTNIQSYLSANKGGTGSEKYLQDKAGGAFQKDQSDLEKSASETKANAQAQVQGVKDAADNSKKWINQAATAYNYDGKQSDPYNELTGKLKTSMNSQYSGPTSYNYTLSGDTDRYGTGLGNEDSYRGIMRDVYKDAAGGQISRGGLDLQEQLDVENEDLANTRQNLLRQYADLGELRDSTTTDVNTALGTARTDYGKAQSKLKDDVLNYGTDRQTATSNAEKAAREAYQNQYYGAALPDSFNGAYGSAGSQLDILRRQGIDTLGELQDYIDNDSSRFFQNASSLGPSSAALVSQLFPALDNFHAANRNQFANTADAEKRQFNTIMDILGQSERKDKGFDVVNRSKNSRGE